MDSQTAHKGSSVPSGESSFEEPESSPHKKIPFGLALVIATFLVVGLLVISGYLWQFSQVK